MDLTRDQIEFLLELLRTKGIAFPLDKCAIAAATENSLQDMLNHAPSA